MATAGIPQKIRANGDRCCRNTAGAVEFPWGWNLFLWELCEYALEILQTIKILAASVRILSKLCLKFLVSLLSCPLRITDENLAVTFYDQNCAYAILNLFLSVTFYHRF